MQGKLYLCATPIGNLEDITLRVLRTLNEVDLIAAEDTRTSKKLLNYYEIRTPLTSYHEHNKYDKGNYLVDKMKEGSSVALITDAGTPGISDPGEELVRMCYAEEIQVTSLPGAAACITALTLSGMSSERFAFEAFLPSKKKNRYQILEQLENEMRTIVLYEAPHRLVKTLKEIYEFLGNRNIAVVRELTKRYETVFKDTIAEVIAYYEEKEPKGECVIIIQGKSQEEVKQDEIERWEGLTLEEHMQYYENNGIDKKIAMKLVAKDRGITKRDVYSALIK